MTDFGHGEELVGSESDGLTRETLVDPNADAADE